MLDENSVELLQSQKEKNLPKNLSQHYSENHSNDSTGLYTIASTSQILEHNLKLKSLENQPKKNPTFTPESDKMLIDNDKSIDADNFLCISEDEEKEDHYDHDMKVSQNSSKYLSNQDQDFDKDDFANEFEIIDPNMSICISSIKKEQIHYRIENKNSEDHISISQGNFREDIYFNSPNGEPKNIQHSPNTHVNIFDANNQPRIDEMDPQYPLPDQVVQPNTTSRRDIKKKRVFKTHVKRKLNMLLYFTDNCQSVMKQPKKKTDEKRGDAKPREYPKKEYFRTKLIRNFKKFLRKKKVSKKYLSEERSQEENIKTAIDDLMIYCNNNEFELSKIAPTESGPGTEAKSKKIENKTQKTYNNKHVKELFSKSEVLEAFKKYVMVVFLEKSPDELSKMFDFFCCDNTSEHTFECYDKWIKLQPFCYSELIEFDSRPENSELA